jgi:hypothetical protein
MNPARVDPVTVTFRTTAETPLAGIPPTPSTARWTVPPAATGLLGAPVPARVSSTRAEVSGMNPPAILATKVSELLLAAKLASPL